MLIGVELTTANVSELLADARALESAGADSLWCFGEGDDPWVFLAALAAATYRARLVAVDAPANEHGRATLERLSRGRVVAATTRRASAGVFVTAGTADVAKAAFARLPDELERWVRTPLPVGREAWNALRASYEAAGATGIVVPNDPRLIDILRNPDVVEDRSDIRLASG